MLVMFLDLWAEYDLTACLFFFARFCCVSLGAGARDQLS